MFFLIAVFTFLLFLGMILYNIDKIVYKEIKVDAVYSEIIYGNEFKKVVIDLTKLPKDNIVGVTYFIEEDEQFITDKIANSILEILEEEYNYKFNAKDRIGALAEIKSFKKVSAPKLFYMKNVILLQNRFTKRYVLEGETKEWTQ